MRGVFWMVLAASVACRGGSDDGTNTDGLEPEDTAVVEDEPTVPLDPDVLTYVPESWPLDDVARVIFLGDSITDGAGVRDQGLSYVSLLLDNDSERYPAYEGQDLRTMYPGIEVIDVSRGGATTSTVLNQQLPQIEAALEGPAQGTTLVVGTIGGNDVTNVVFRLGNLDEEGPAIAEAVDEIAVWFADAGRFPDGAAVYLTNIYEPTDAVGRAEECFYGLDVSNVQPAFEDINSRTLDFAEANGWSWVDLRGHFLGHGFNHDDEDSPAYEEDDPSLWLADDCIHPNQRGHNEVRRLFLSAIENRPLPL